MGSPTPPRPSRCHLAPAGLAGGCRVTPQRRLPVRSSVGGGHTQRRERAACPCGVARDIEQRLVTLTRRLHVTELLQTFGGAPGGLVGRCRARKIESHALESVDR